MVTNIMSKTRSFVSKAHAIQLQRIEEDEKIYAQEESIRKDHKANLNATWSQSLEEITQSRIMKRLNAEIEQEIRLTNKALTKVRRERLKHLLDNECDEFRRELNESGLTFYNERK